MINMTGSPRFSSKGRSPSFPVKCRYSDSRGRPTDVGRFCLLRFLSQIGRCLCHSTLSLAEIGRYCAAWSQSCTRLWQTFTVRSYVDDGYNSSFGGIIVASCTPACSSSYFEFASSCFYPNSRTLSIRWEFIFQLVEGSHTVSLVRF